MPVSEIIPTKFSIQHWVVVVLFTKEIIFNLRLRSMCAVSVKLSNPIEFYGKLCSHVVFPASVAPNLKLEQTGIGFLCINETIANEIIKVIEERNRSPQVVLVSAPGFFSLATLKKEVTQRRLVLFPFAVPTIKYGVAYGFALRIWKYFIDQPRELIWEDLLPTTDLSVAENIMRKKQIEMAIRSAEIPASLPIVEPALIKSQFLFLSKAFPETVGFLKNPNASNADAAYAAYQRETLVVTGQLDGVLDKGERAKLAKQLENDNRRKHPAYDEGEYELVAGWQARGYDRMTPAERFDNLKRLGFDPVSPDAIRKTCERLKLPPAKTLTIPQPNK